MHSKEMCLDCIVITVRAERYVYVWVNNQRYLKGEGPFGDLLWTPRGHSRAALYRNPQGGRPGARVQGSLLTVAPLPPPVPGPRSAVLFLWAAAVVAGHRAAQDQGPGDGSELTCALASLPCSPLRLHPPVRAIRLPREVGASERHVCAWSSSPTAG